MDEPGSPITVRHPAEEDIKALAAFGADTRSETGAFEKRHQLLYREIKLSKSPRKFFLIIEYKREIAGFIRVVKSTNPLSRLWWLAGLEIKQALRRKGLGSYLVREALYHIYHRGGKNVILEVDRENEGAVLFYNRLNFTDGHGITAATVGRLHPEKKVLMIDLKKNRDWVNRPEAGFKYMGIGKTDR